MVSCQFIFGCVLTIAAASSSAIVPRSSLSDLILDQAPNYVRPYVIRHYANAQTVVIGSQVYRFPVTGPSSDYAFSLLLTSAPQSSSLGVLPHIHERHYENFFNFKGRYQLWAQSSSNDSTQESRVLTQGDYGAVPRNTTHTFQILDPDTEMLGVISPGGFEKLFYALGTNWTSTTHTPYIPATSAADTTSAGNNATEISELESFDVYAQLDFEETQDAVDGAYPLGSTWHNGSNELGASDSAPYFVANGWGPKYLNSQHGYQVVQPLVTAAQSADTDFTMSTISINGLLSSTTVPLRKFTGSAAFTVLEGQLSIRIQGYPTATLDTGDVVFVPGGTAYRYWSVPSFTKVLLVSAGHEGLDSALIEGGEAWDYVTFPAS